MSKLIETRTVEAISHFSKTINSTGKVVADMTLLAEATAELPLVRLDYWERFIRLEFAKAMESQTKPRWKLWGDTPQILTWLDIVSWDGYTRERTLRTLSGPAPNRFFFALALRRLNDWVPQVREAAKVKILELADVSEPSDVVEAMCLTLSHWNSWGRMQTTEKDIIIEILSKKSIAAALRSKIISSPSGLMVFLFSQVSRDASIDDYISIIAEQAVQPAVRAKAFRCLFDQEVTWSEGKKWEWTDIRYCEGRYSTDLGHRTINTNHAKLDLLLRSAADNSSIVRRVSAEFLIKHLRDIGMEANHLAKQFASDKSSAVSERGQFALRKIAELDN